MANQIEIIKHVVKAAKPTWQTNRHIQQLLAGEHTSPYQPAEAGDEYRRIQKASVLNLLPLVLDTLSQSLFVEGYVTKGQSSTAWSMWQRERMDSRQIAVHREALSYGSCLVGVLPTSTGWHIKGLSALSSYAMWDDPESDPFPQVVVSIQKRNKEQYLTYVDDSVIAKYLVDGDNYQKLSEQPHNMGVCPVVRFSDGLDLDGDSEGQIAPLERLQLRINQANFDLGMTSTYSSYKVRTATGMLLSDDDDERSDEQIQNDLRKIKMKMGQDRILIADDPDVKFGTLDSTPLDGHINAVELSVRLLASVSQVPPHALLGSMINLSAEALAAAESGLQRKVQQIQHSLGESWESVLRLCAASQGDAIEASDYSSEVTWADTSARSLSQAADAWGKAVQMLGLPSDVAIRKLPGITQADVARIEAARASDPLTDLASLLTQKQYELDDDVVTDVVDVSEAA